MVLTRAEVNIRSLTKGASVDDAFGLEESVLKKPFIKDY